MCIKYCGNLNNKEDFKHIFNTYMFYYMFVYLQYYMYINIVKYKYANI